MPNSSIFPLYDDGQRLLRKKIGHSFGDAYTAMAHNQCVDTDMGIQAVSQKVLSESITTRSIPRITISKAPKELKHDLK